MSTKQEKNSIRLRKEDVFLIAAILVYLLNSSYLMNGLENSIEIFMMMVYDTTAHKKKLTIISWVFLNDY